MADSPEAGMLNHIVQQATISQPLATIIQQATIIQPLASVANETEFKCNILRQAVMAPEEKLRLVHLGSLLGAKQVRKPTLRALKAVMKCCPYFEITTDGRSRILVKEATYRAAKLAARKERATEKNTRKWLMRVAMLGNTIREERSQRKAYEKAGTHIAWWHPMHLALRNPLVFLTIREDTPRENDPLVTRVQHVRNEQKEAARRILVSIGEDPRIGAEYGV